MFEHISMPVSTLVPRLEVEEQYISNSRLRYHQLPIKSTPGQEEYFSNPAPPTQVNYLSVASLSVQYPVLQARDRRACHSAAHWAPYGCAPPPSK